MEDLHQSLVFDCPAHAFYETFLDEEEHAELTGATASIDPREGGHYAAFNYELTGEFIKLVPDELIIMNWRSNIEDWPEDHDALVRIELFQSSDGTTVEFEIIGVPEELAPAIEEGWQTLFWEPLQRHFAW